MITTINEFRKHNENFNLDDRAKLEFVMSIATPEQREVLINFQAGTEQLFLRLLKGAVTVQLIDDTLQLMVNDVEGDESQLEPEHAAYARAKGWLDVFNENAQEDDEKLLDLRNMDKVIAELGPRGATKMPVAQFVYNNIERLTGKDASHFNDAYDFGDGVIADMIGYYLMDGEDFIKDWNDIKAKNESNLPGINGQPAICMEPIQEVATRDHYIVVVGEDVVDSGTKEWMDKKYDSIPKGTRPSNYRSMYKRVKYDD